MHFSAGVEIDPKVYVVESGFDRVIRRIISGVLTAGCGLYKKILFNFAGASADENPGVEALTDEFISRLVVRLIIVNVDQLKRFAVFILALLYFGFFIVL